MYKKEIEQDPALCGILCDNEGKVLNEGDIIFRKNYSRTLEIIAENPNDYYEVILFICFIYIHLSKFIYSYIIYIYLRDQLLNQLLMKFNDEVV